MKSRIKLVRGTLGVLLAASLIYVGWLVAHVDRKLPVTVESKVEPGIAPGGEDHGESENLVVDWDGGAFRRLEAARARKGADGSVALEGGLVLQLERGGGLGNLVVRAAGGEMAGEQPDRMVVRGSVEVTGDDGFVLRSEELELDRQRKRIVSRSPVTFATGDVHGEAGRLEHDWESKETLLSINPVLRLVGDRTRGKDVELRAANVRLSDAKRIVEARERATIVHEGGTLSARSIDLQLRADADELSRLVAEGGASSISQHPEADGRVLVRTLRGERIVHHFTGASVLRSIEASGDAELRGVMAGTPADQPLELVSGDTLHLVFTGAGPALDKVTAIGMPARAAIRDGASKREVAARQVDATFDASGKLTSLVADGDASTQEAGPGADRQLQAEHAAFSFGPDGERVDTVTFKGGPARMVESQPRPGGKVDRRTVVASSGEVTVGPDGEVVRGTLEGGVRLGTGTSEARGEKATVDEVTGHRVLTGNPSVETEGRTSHGETVVYDPKAGTVTVRGGQHTVVRGAAAAQSVGTFAPGEEPIYISSDQLLVHEQQRRATYSGGRPTMRRGDNEVASDLLELDDAAGTLHAKGKVASKLRLGKPGDERPEGTTLFDPGRLIDGASEELRFRRADNLVHYQGGVKLSQAGTTLSADSVEIRLAPEGGRVESLKADGHALFKSPEQEAEGESLEYRASDARIRVTGGKRPARAKDAQGNFMTGAELEMHVGQPGISVRAPAGGRTRGAAQLAQPAGTP